MKASAAAVLALLFTAVAMTPAGASASTLYNNPPAVPGASAPDLFASFAPRKAAPSLYPSHRLDAEAPNPDAWRDSVLDSPFDLKMDDQATSASISDLVPEPAAWLLMFVGLGLVGFRLRKLNGPTR